MFEEIDTTIQTVERLYRAVSGREAKGAEAAPIPPERDAAKHVDEQLDKLLAALTRVPQAVAPIVARPAMPAWAPPVSMFTRKNELLVCVDVPGVTREHLSVTATAASIAISGRRPSPFSDGETRLTRGEAPLGAFRREIPLPSDVSLAELSASLKDGVLEIRVPRAEKQAPRAIHVQ